MRASSFARELEKYGDVVPEELVPEQGGLCAAAAGTSSQDDPAAAQSSTKKEKQVTRLDGGALTMRDRMQHKVGDSLPGGDRMQHKVGDSLPATQGRGQDATQGSRFSPEDGMVIVGVVVFAGGRLRPRRADFWVMGRGKSAWSGRTPCSGTSSSGITDVVPEESVPEESVASCPAWLTVAP